LGASYRYSLKLFYQSYEIVFSNDFAGLHDNYQIEI